MPQKQNKIIEDQIKSKVDGQETILVTEDEPAILKMTTMMLERHGYKVLGASTPAMAIALAKDHPGEIHLLITDVIMPEMNGWELAKELLCFYPNLKQLFMSGYAANAMVHQGIIDKGVHFIQKPFSMQNLIDKLRKLLAQQGN